MRISAIAAIGENRELGKENKLLWYIPEDLKRFQKLTRGHPVIMGRKTFESIGKVLPRRLNIVITRNNSFRTAAIAMHSDVEGKTFRIANNLREALEIARNFEEVRSKEQGEQDTKYEIQNTDEVFVIGGGQIYKEAMPYLDRLYLTIVHNSFDADTFFPEYPEFTKVIEEEDHEGGEYNYTFLTLER